MKTPTMTFLTNYNIHIFVLNLRNEKVRITLDTDLNHLINIYI